MNNLNHSRTLAARLFIAALLLGSAGSALADVHYVDVNSTDPAPPFTSWATAATNIQDAVDAAIAGDEIVVTNGIYATGGRATADDTATTNRVLVDKPLALRSVNGPQSTTIDGGGVFRCVYLTNGASLGGFTVTHGFAVHGAGIRCESTQALVSKCLVTSNSTPSSYYNWSPQFPAGAGAYGGTLNDCTLSSNSALGLIASFGIIPNWTGGGGGAANATLNRCTLARNSAGSGGGAAVDSTLENCLLAQNHSGVVGGGAARCLLSNCTVAGNSTPTGGNNESGPGYESGGAWRSTLINCIVQLNSADIGANYDSFSTLNYSCATPLPLNGVGNISADPLFANAAAGNYRLRPDSPCIDAGTNLSAIITNDLDGRPRPLDGNSDGLAAFDMGAYEYRTPLLVWQDSPNPTPPHADWLSAAHTIQDAVDAAVAGDEIVVTNGIYATGGRSGNRVKVDKPLSLRSIIGPQSTTIDGGSSSRCVYLSSGVSLSGFTLTNGRAPSGGGLWCESTNAVVFNCVVSGNSTFAEIISGGFDGPVVSPAFAGGVYGGTLNNCILSDNQAQDYYSPSLVYRPSSGGGAGNATLNNCILTRNSAGYGGGAAVCTLNNCRLNGNSASAARFASGGGGAFNTTLNNCTLTSNSADRGGGAQRCALNNCIVYFNTAADGVNYDSFGVSTLNYCCTTPLPTDGFGNMTNAPLVVELFDGSLRLQTNSPCINAGRNAFAPAGFDLDGNPRITGRTVDIGAYEFQSPASIISYAWLQQFGLPNDGSADSADPDGDRMNNWQEWRCATDPASALSALRLLAPTVIGSDLLVRWESVADRTYFLERSPTASSAFTPLATGIPGQPGTTTCTHTNASGAGPSLYRVGVEE